jgi:hypothetical protein
VDREDGNGWVLVWDHGNWGLFSLERVIHPVELLLQFPLAISELIGFFIVILQ